MAARSSAIHHRGQVLLQALLAAGALLIWPFRTVQAQATTSEFWPELDAYVRLSSAARLFLVMAPVISRDDKSLSEQQLGATIDVGIAPIAPARRLKAQDADKLRYLRFRPGYYRTGTHDSTGTSLSERRLIAEITPRAFLPFDVLVALRGRVDFRWLEEGYSWRPRVRLWIEREGPVGPVVLIPYVSAETFYDSRYDAWSRTYYQAGIAVPVSRRVVPELYYGRQNCGPGATAAAVTKIGCRPGVKGSLRPGQEPVPIFLRRRAKRGSVCRLSKAGSTRR